MAGQGAEEGHKPFLIREGFADDLELVEEALADRLSPGTPLPAEWHDFQLAAHMGWSSAELDACPIYRRRLWLEFLYMEREAAAQAMENARNGGRASAADQAAARSEIEAARAAVGYQQPND